MTSPDKSGSWKGVAGGAAVCLGIAAFMNPDIVSDALEGLPGNNSSVDWPDIQEQSTSGGDANDSQSESRLTSTITGTGTLRFGTYNVLGAGPAKIYKGVANYNSRAVRAVDQIDDAQIAVVGLQEVNKRQFSVFKRELAKRKYKIWPETYEGANSAGSKPIAYDTNQVELVKGGSFRVTRFCKTIYMPYGIFKSNKIGEFAMFNEHMSPNGPSKKPCTKDSRTGNGSGADNDDGPTSRTVSTSQFLFTADELQETWAARGKFIPVINSCDCNSKRTLRKDKDATVKKDQLPIIMMEKEGYKDSYATSKHRRNDGYSTSHGSVKKFNKTGYVIDHVVGDGVRWDNWTTYVDRKFIGVTDHSMVTADGTFSPSTR